MTAATQRAHTAIWHPAPRSPGSERRGQLGGAGQHPPHTPPVSPGISPAWAPQQQQPSSFRGEEVSPPCSCSGGSARSSCGALGAVLGASGSIAPWPRCVPSHPCSAMTSADQVMTRTVAEFLGLYQSPSSFLSTYQDAITSSNKARCTSQLFFQNNNIFFPSPCYYSTAL